MALKESAVKLLYDEAMVLLHHPRPESAIPGAQFDALKTDFNNRIKPTVPTAWLGDPEGSTWDQMNPEQHAALGQALTESGDALRQLLNIDSGGPGSFMYDRRASNTAIWCLFGYSLTLVFLTGGAVISLWSSATQSDNTLQSSVKTGDFRKQVDELSAAVEMAQKKRDVATDLDEKATSSEDKEKVESAQKEADVAESRMRATADLTGRILTQIDGPGEFVVLWVVIMMGALGGTLRLISSVVRYIGNRQLDRSWIAYYIAMPVQGALLAPIVFMLLRVGILAPSFDGENATGHLNLIGIYAFAALTGLFANQAMLKLRDVFEEVFRPKENDQKDPLTSPSPEAETTG